VASRREGEGERGRPERRGDTENGRVGVGAKASPLADVSMSPCRRVSVSPCLRVAVSPHRRVAVAPRRPLAPHLVNPHFSALFPLAICSFGQLS